MADVIRSKYGYKTLRAEAVLNKQSAALELIEINWAEQVDEANDKWRVARCEILGFGTSSPKVMFKTIEENVDFQAALTKLSEAEYLAKRATMQYQLLDRTEFEKDYPESASAVLKKYYYDIEHYVRPAHIMGFAFSDDGTANIRQKNQLFMPGSYSLAELEKSVTVREEAAKDPSTGVNPKMEEGLLSEIFNKVADSRVDFDQVMNAMATLIHIDRFAQEFGGFYLAIQEAAGVKDGLSKVSGFASTEEKKAFLQAAKDAQRSSEDCSEILEVNIPAMKSVLQDLKDEDVHTEPFEKLVAECEMYTLMLQSRLTFGKVSGDLEVAGKANAGDVASIRAETDKVFEIFKGVGGTAGRMDDLRAWVGDEKKGVMMDYLHHFLTRYYEERAVTVAKVKQRQAGETEVKVMSEAVRPSI